MLVEELKLWLQKDIKPTDKLLLLLMHFRAPIAVKDLKTLANDHGYRFSKKINISSLLTKSSGCAIRLPSGWEITQKGIERLVELGVTTKSENQTQLANNLRLEMHAIVNIEVRNFVEEAILCYEYDAYRSAVVMSWLAAMAVLHTHIIQNHLTEFNTEVKRVDAKWKPAKNGDDLSKMRESDFLNRINAISVIGKNTKKELQNCLDRRNACGHPNSYKLGDSTVAHHLETLLLNVFQKFNV